MATFKVGQRVRIRYCQHPEVFGDHSGKEGTVTGHRYGRNTVLIDGRPELRCDGYPNLFEDDQLEPIQYDGNKVIEWSECLWQPSHETA